MDIVPVSTVTLERACLRREELARLDDPSVPEEAIAPCGQCEHCRRVVMIHLAAYALKEEDPKGTLLDLLTTMELRQA